MGPTSPKVLDLAPACPYCGMIWADIDMRDLDEGESLIVECTKCEGESRFHRLRFKYTTHILH